MGNTHRILIRPVMPEDRSAIIEFCKHTWDHEADYIKDILDRWMQDPSGQILVADSEGQAVGMTRIAKLSETEGWWEGLRVARPYRGQGIAHSLANATLEQAKTLGLSTVRTCVNVYNVRMNSLIQRWGYTPLNQHTVYRADATSSIASTLTHLRGDRLESVWSAVQRLNPVPSNALFVRRGATWQALTKHVLAQRLREGRVWGMLSAHTVDSLFIRSYMDTPDGTLWIGWVGGLSTHLSDVLQSIRYLAHQLGYRYAGGFFPQSPSLVEALIMADYQPIEGTTYRVHSQILR